MLCVMLFVFCWFWSVLSLLFFFYYYLTLVVELLSPCDFSILRYMVVYFSLSATGGFRIPLWVVHVCLNVLALSLSPLGFYFFVCRHGHTGLGAEILLLALHFRYFVLPFCFGHGKRRRIHGLDLGGDILGLRLGCWGFTLKKLAPASNRGSLRTVNAT
jgi:hypothetical protein